ncbi:MAG TPA: RNA chaperone Hfq, partial [Candidatus Competibacteraceae bacterium]|nr:RNA chaperone Hfq [Candidatus Competibacteraceae bacterium]
PTVALKAIVTRRQAEPVPSDMAERLQQLQHHEAAEADTAAGASTFTEPAQAQDLEPAPEPEGSPVPELEKSRKQRKRDERREASAVQSAFLAGNLGKSITVFTINGVRLTGRLKQFDQYCVLLEGPAPMLLFKHMISTITPAR